MLTKENCESALEEYDFRSERPLPHEYSLLRRLINEHFELQLTVSECDLIISSLNPLEEELGMDVTLLINKVRKLQSKLPKQEGVVECVEFD